MGRTNRGRACLASIALAATVALTGCTIPFINVELPDLPFSLPELPFELPSFDLDELPVPTFTLPIGVTTTVDDARLEVLSSNASTLDDAALVMPGYLSVGVKTASSSAPLCVEGDFGSLYGLDVDLGAAVASEMGLLVRYVPVVDAAGLGTECDVIMNGRSNNPNAIAIAGTYVESATSFFHKGETTVSAITDLNGKSVGLQGGSNSETVLNKTGLKMSQKSFANLNEAFDSLAAGEIDYVLCEAYPGAYLASLHPGVTFAGALEAPETSGIAVSATNTELVTRVQEAFDTISSNGILDIARSRWVGKMPTLTVDSQIQNVPTGSMKPAASEPASEDAEATAEGGETVEGEGGEDNDGSDAGANAITNI